MVWRYPCRAIRHGHYIQGQVRKSVLSVNCMRRLGINAAGVVLVLDGGEMTAQGCNCSTGQNGWDGNHSMSCPLYQYQEDGLSEVKIGSASERPTLRDQFAMAAMTGMLANPNNGGTYELLAEAAYGYADAMLAERAKERK